MPAPPPFVYLYGHAPSSNWPLRGWVSTWLGAYALQPELMNGRPVYGRDDALLHSSQRLWFAYTDATRGFWFFGPASGLGGSLGWLSAFDTSLAPPHSSWSTASEEDKVAWVPAPGLRVSANRSDAAGWFRSSVTAAAAPGLEASSCGARCCRCRCCRWRTARRCARRGRRRAPLAPPRAGSRQPVAEAMSEAMQAHVQLAGAQVHAFLASRPHCLMLTYVLMSALLLLGLYLCGGGMQRSRRNVASRHIRARAAQRSVSESTGRPDLSEARHASVSACMLVSARTCMRETLRCLH